MAPSGNSRASLVAVNAKLVAVCLSPALQQHEAGPRCGGTAVPGHAFPALGLSGCCLEQPARLLHLQSGQKRTLLPAGCSVSLAVDHRSKFECLVKLLQGLQQAGSPGEAHNTSSVAVTLSAPAAAAEACLRQMMEDMEGTLPLHRLAWFSSATSVLKDELCRRHVWAMLKGWLSDGVALPGSAAFSTLSRCGSLTCGQPSIFDFTHFSQCAGHAGKSSYLMPLRMCTLLQGVQTNIVNHC